MIFFSSVKKWLCKGSSSLFPAPCVCGCGTGGWGEPVVAHAGCRSSLCVWGQCDTQSLFSSVPVAVPCGGAAHVYFRCQLCSAGVPTPMLLTQNCTLALLLGLLSDELCGMALLWISSFHWPFFTTPWLLSVSWGQSVHAMTLTWGCWSQQASQCSAAPLFPWHISENSLAVCSFSSLNVPTAQGIFLSSFRMSGKNAAQSFFCTWYECELLVWVLSGFSRLICGVAHHVTGALCKYEDQIQIFFHLAKILKGGQMGVISHWFLLGQLCLLHVDIAHYLRICGDTWSLMQILMLMKQLPRHN